MAELNIITAAAIAYLIVFTLFWVLVLASAVTALTHLDLTIFRSLGRAYLSVLLGLFTALHLLNCSAVLQLVFIPDVAIIEQANGALTGVRMWLVSMVFSALIGRQFMLGRIFGVIPAIRNRSALQRFQSFWPPLIVCSCLWLPMLALFFLADENIISTEIFVILYAVFYVAYATAFIWLAVKNKHVSQIYSDYKMNVIVGSLLLFLVVMGLIIGLLLQVLTVNTYAFEMSITYLFGVLFAIVALIVYRPFFQYHFHKAHVSEWEEFNKKNAFLYGGKTPSARRERSFNGSKHEGEHASEHSNEMLSSKEQPSNLLSSSEVIDSLTVSQQQSNTY